MNKICLFIFCMIIFLGNMYGAEIDRNQEILVCKNKQDVIARIMYEALHCEMQYSQFSVNFLNVLSQETKADSQVCLVLDQETGKRSLSFYGIQKNGEIDQAIQLNDFDVVGYLQIADDNVTYPSVSITFKKTFKTMIIDKNN